jgi:penicillin-binding protein 2
MFADGDWRRTPMPAQFALRVAILSGVALVMFALIFFRLWYLQVLSGDKYLHAAENNQVREITVQAPRGEILDRNGDVLVDNRTSLALQVRPDELPKVHAQRIEELKHLSAVAGIPLDEIKKQIRVQTKDLPANPVTLKRDVPYDLVYFLRENQARFSGVSVQRVYVRAYPDGTMAAHVLGYVGEVNAEQLKEPRYQGLEPGDTVGQGGVEDTYDSVLRGVNGKTRVQVDASGRPTGGQLSAQQPRPGDNLVLTIDGDVQRAGEQALSSRGLPGAFAAMDVSTGQILGLGSYPTYDPSIFAKPTIPQSTFNFLYSQTTDAPIFDRAVSGGYPTGSTFKPITAVAALESGALTPTETLYDSGSFTEGGITLHNAGNASYGSLQLPEALQVSSDVFFYQVGARLDQETNGDTQSGPQQQWAENLGIGSDTGIDIPGEDSSAYLVPSPEWRNDLYKQATQPDSPGGTNVVLGEVDRPWTSGDSVNLAVGQGDLKTNPLQMAVAYAAIANGGNVVRPHVGLEVTDQGGRVVQEIQPAPQRHLDIDPDYSRAILEGLHMAAQQDGGTSFSVFGNFPIPVAGKTGTAERPLQEDQSWYVVLAPYPDPQIVVAVTIERAGFGAQAAAPAACTILQAYFGKAAESKNGDTCAGPSSVPTTSTGTAF